MNNAWTQEIERLKAELAAKDKELAVLRKRLAAARQEIAALFAKLEEAEKIMPLKESSYIRAIEALRKRLEEAEKAIRDIARWGSEPLAKNHVRSFVWLKNKCKEALNDDDSPLLADYTDATASKIWVGMGKEADDESR